MIWGETGTRHGATSAQLVSVAWFTINYTRKQGKPLAIIWPNGFITYENWTLT